jgi:hypothetical protein
MTNDETQTMTGVRDARFKRCARLQLLLFPVALLLNVSGNVRSETAAGLQPTVELEEEVYTYEPANNGAGPMWCAGSTCLVRIGNGVFASGLETLKEAKPLNNCRWMLFRRGPVGWEKVRVDESGRTREPSPLTGFPDGRLFLSANPTLGSGAEPGGGPARPELFQFSAAHPQDPPERIPPVWSGTPPFTEHCIAASRPTREP